MLNTLKELNKHWPSAKRRAESGNVLFLILIAVALFAALSYAVTQSSRSGGGDASSETNLISSAEITQYPASVRTAIIRMAVSNGADVTALEFNPPSAFGSLSDPSVGVFHPDGGGATYTTASDDIMLQSGTNPSGTWNFSAHYEITYVGVSDGATSFDGNDIIAFLPDVKSSICSKINDELGISGDTTHTSDLDVSAAAQQMDDAYNTATAGGATVTLGTAGGAAGLDSQPFGCVTDSAGEHIYYHVLVER